MTARRGSLRFKVGRLAQERKARVQKRLRTTAYVRALAIGGRATVVTVAVLVALAFGAQAWRLTYQNYELHRQIVQVETQNRSLAAQTVRLKREIILSREPEYLVPLIHEQLGLTKPKEVFIQVAPPPAPKR